MAVKVEFLRKKIVKLVNFKEINYPKVCYQRDFLQFVQFNFVEISLRLIGFKLQVLQANYFVNLVTINQKQNQYCSVQISSFLVNFMVKQFLQIRNQVKTKQVIKLHLQTNYQFGQAVPIVVQINQQKFIEKLIQQQVIY